MEPLKSASRFSDRVENYVKYRPRYPDQAFNFFRNELGLTASAAVADVGSGTGFSAEPFLKNGNLVYCVEPNPEMRQASERLLASFPNFRSIDGTAEATGLADQSTDFIVCGQAFHWFDPVSAKIEFQRIARRPADVVLMWNDRLKQGDALLEAYEQLLHRYGTDYVKVDHSNITREQISSFLGSDYGYVEFPHFQEFDLEGFLGRVFSSSYTPAPGTAQHESLKRELCVLFDQHQRGGSVIWTYVTRVYHARWE